MRSDSREFCQVDVFTTERYRGNAAAVIFDADGLEGEAMQAIAREMNLSETVFVLSPSAPEADYRVRMFTPRSEMPFAGHPTLATALAMTERHPSLRAKTPGVVRQECGIGVVSIEIQQRDGEARSFWMTMAPPVRRGVEVDSEQAARLLGSRPVEILDVPIQVVSVGAPWLIAPLKSPASIARLSPDFAAIKRICSENNAVGLTTFAIEANAQGRSVRVRTFAPGEGVDEDPVCGSGNGSVAAYIAGAGLFGAATFAYVAHQGLEIDRPGRVHVQCAPGPAGIEIRIGGHAVRVMEGRVLL